MISAGEFRNGVTMEYEGNIYQVIEFQHVKPGKGAAFVRTKLKNLVTGAVVEKTFRPTEKMPKAMIERKDMTYLYNDGDLYNFMDAETYDQIAIPASEVGDALKFVKENENVKVLSHNGNIFGIEPPLFVELEVTETEPGFKGDTATGATKPATVETGAQINVPLFINQGEIIKIDTRNGKPVKGSYRVKCEDEVVFSVPESVEPDIEPENIPLDILYEDADLIVVNKPKGMVVHPAAGHYTGTLVNALMYHCGNELSGINGVLRPGIVHRIDRDTTGSVIACKNDKAHRCIAEQLKEHSINRRYRAICFGELEQEEGTIAIRN